MLNFWYPYNGYMGTNLFIPEAYLNCAFTSSVLHFELPRGMIISFYLIEIGFNKWMKGIYGARGVQLMKILAI